VGVTATTTQERPTETPAHGPGTGTGRARRRSGWVVLLGVVLLVALGALFAARELLPSIGKPFTPETTDRSQPAVLKALEDLHEYRAATGQFQVIVDLEHRTRYVPTLLKGERTLFVAGGSVDAFVDFSQLGAEAVTVSQDRRSVTVTLPRATLSRARVDPSQSYVYERERGLVDRVGAAFSDNPTSERELYLLAEQKLSKAAAAGDVTDRAEENTRQMLTGLLRSLGFTDLDIVFA